MLKKSRKANPTFTRLGTETREKQFTLNFSKASPTQADKGQAKPFYFKQFSRIPTQNFNEEVRSKTDLKNPNYAL